MHAEQIINMHPQVRGNANDALIHCIEECFDCAQICTSCADACLGEEMLTELRQCIRLNLDCTNICAATGFVATRRTGANETVIVAALAACEHACARCAEECERHAADMEHCRICAEACRRCERACRAATEAIQPRH